MMQRGARGFSGETWATWAEAGSSIAEPARSAATMHAEGALILSLSVEDLESLGQLIVTLGCLNGRLSGRRSNSPH
jgi:hypothetical protein